MPAGVAEHALVLRTSGLAIPAAFTAPTDRAVTAALLFIPGSLFCDVNGDFPSWNSFPGTNAYLARQLAARGVAVYRYAKAGPGTGTVVEDQAAWDAVRTWDGRVTIARAALTAFRATIDEMGLDVPVFVSGHSEGAVVASRLVAEYDAEASAAGVVLLAGPAVGILGVMRERTEREAPADERAARLAAMDAVIDCIHRGVPVPDEYKALPVVAGLASMPLDGHRYLAQCDRTDPCATVARIDGPVLVVQGDADDTVTVHDAKRLVAARGGKPTDLMVLDGIGHMFKRVPPGTDPWAVFGWPGPCDERVADGVARWMAARARDQG